MARTQTLIWTALPNGYRTAKDGKQYLKLSIFLAPRLETTAPTGTLGEFPDFQSAFGAGPPTNWADSANAITWGVEAWIPTRTGHTHKTYAATKTSAAAEPELWDQLFGPAMPIKQFVFRNMTATSVKTFSSKSVYSLVKKQYAAIASIPARNYVKPTISKLVSLPGVTTPPLVSVLPTAVANSSGVSALVGASAAVTQNASYKAFEEFHKPYDLPPDFNPYPDTGYPPMDFHRALSALANYPALLRRLGLVIDIEIPFSATIATAKRVRLIPTWPDGRPARGRTIVVGRDTLALIDALQWTACEFSVKGTSPVVVKKFQTKSRDGKVKDGYLVVRSITSSSSDPIRLYNVDVDLAAARMMATASSAASMLNRAVYQAVSKSTAAGAATDEATVTASAVEAVSSKETMTLPPLGQPMIRMSMVSLANRVKAQMAVAATMNAKLVAGLEQDTIVYAEDVTRGYRVDAWDSVTRQWHRLCGRIGRYSVGETPITWGNDPTIQDEGWVQLGGISAPTDVLTNEPPTEMRVHESVFDWSGWSLAVPRPGNALSEPDGDGVTTPTKTFQDPQGNTTDIGHFIHPDLPLDVRWSVPPGDLPRLRFGTTYRFRARAVDLAGNGRGFSSGSTTSDPGGSGDSSPYVTRAIVHKRFDPVKPPTVVPVDTPKPSESPHVLVVRSYHPPGGGSVVTENAARHITPPRTAVTMAEACKGLEASTTGRPMDKALWAELCARDAYDAPQAVPAGKTQPEALPMPTFPSPVPYLPDVYARGAAFKKLPGVASVTTSRTIASGVKVSGVRVPLSSTKTTTVSSFRVTFEKSGGPWYEREPFKLSLRGVEGTDGRLSVRGTPALPGWDAVKRDLRVDVPKADEYSVDMSSYMKASDLAVMGVHQWSMETFKPSLKMVLTPAIKSVSASAASTSLNAVPVYTSSSLSTTANALITAAKIGQNWMVTPPQELKLIHAVDLPMISPKFTTRAHMERKAGETHSTLVDWMAIHGKSTAKVDIKASWTENVDDPAASAPKWGPTAVAKNAAVFSQTIPRSRTTTLNAGQSLPSRMKTVSWGKIPSTGQIISKSGVDAKGQRHHFGDTKHRLVTYSATYTSRYEKYFADMPDLSFSLTSPPKNLHVPSSARPAAPVLDYIVPTFGWSRATGSSTRYGGGLRVYLERPWFSSGDGELLGVVLYQSGSSSTAWSRLEPYVSRWGNDPLWTTSGVLPGSLPTSSRFKGSARKASGLKLREYTSSPVIAVGYDVKYDEATKRWFADIRMYQGKAYFPFLKLALVRYQPYSLPGYELSSVVVADFVQLAPDRWASASVGADGWTVTCSMTGQSYVSGAAGRIARVTMQLQKRLSDGEADLGWVDMGSEIAMPRIARTTYQIITGDTRRTWRAVTKLAEKEAGTSYRALIREYEMHRTYNEADPAKPNTDAQRLIFAEAIPLSV